MKLKKDVKNIISIILLIFILFVLIFAITSLNKETSLSAGGNTEKPETKPPFTSPEARASLINGIAYENNFGGSGKDEILGTYKLDNFILIGKTNSTDFYCSNLNNTNLTIQYVSYGGKLDKMYSCTLADNFEFVSSVIFNNSIFILINADNEFKLIEFNLTNKTFVQKLSQNGVGITLVAADDLVVIFNENNKTNFTFVNSNKEISLNYIVSDIKLTANYSNGILTVFNYNNSIQILYISPNSIKTLNTINNSKLETFNITSSGVIFITQTENINKLILLNMNFEVLSEKIISNGTNFSLIQFGKYNILSYLSGNSLKQTVFCSCGDELVSSEIYANVQNYYLFNNKNRIYYLLKTSSNSINLINTNPLNQTNENLIIPGLNNLNIKQYEINFNSNLTVFGEFNNINSLITKNYGNTDVFMFEIIINT